MGFLYVVLALVVVLGPLVFFHELGHFLAAKLFKVRVEVFSVGFGPRLLGFQRGETDYRIAPIPLGGYVKMAGEYSDEPAPVPAADAKRADPGASDAPDPARVDPGMLTSKPRWQRLIIMAAGPAFNVALAIGIWWGVALYAGAEIDLPDSPPVVGEVAQGSAAAQAGIQPGDRLLAVGETEVKTAREHFTEVIFRANETVTYRVERNGEPRAFAVTIDKDDENQVGVDGIRIRAPISILQVSQGKPADLGGMRAGDLVDLVDGEVVVDQQSLIEKIKASAGQTLSLVVERDGQRVELSVTPEADANGEGLIGVGLGLPLKPVGPWRALESAVGEAWKNSDIIFRTLKALVTANLGIGALSGPIEIARVSQQQLATGWLPGLRWAAILSLQLGILNLLPIPVLDGGQIVLLLIEGVRGRDLSPVLKERILMTGVVMLVALMVTVIGMDVLKGIRRANAPPPAAEAPSEPPPDAVPESP